MSSMGVSYDTWSVVDSHLYANAFSQVEKEDDTAYIELLRRRLCTSLELARSALGAITV